jgi:allophanate hydrolase
MRIGTPDLAALEREVDPAWFAGYRAGLDALCALGHQLVTIDDAPFRRAAAALYGGAWVAERTAAVGDFLDRLATTNSPDADPTVSAIIRGGRVHDAVAAWRSVYDIAALRREADARWQHMDVLALPTVSDHPTLAAVRADPIGVNSRMGRFTNFANLLDTCAVALPTPRTTTGLPTGLTLFAPAWHDHWLAWLGAQMQDRLALPLGATGFLWAHVLPESCVVARPASDQLPVAVFGAHLRGQPLNHRLLALGGTYVRDIRSAPRYRCCLLDAPPRPGLIPVHDGSGAPFAGELWHLPAAGLGRLVTEVLFPLTLGTIELDDGQRVTGFVCADGVGRPDITASGSWRGWLAQRSS